MPDIKILITYHDEHKVLKSDILTPIQTGCANATALFPNMLYDNDGDNISDLNPQLCEFSAIYWAWKNYKKLGDPKYIGFMHYRRHFIFNDKKYNASFYDQVPFKELNETYITECGLDDKSIRQIVSDNDIVMAYPYKTSGNYDQYKEMHHIQDYDKAIKYVQKNYPDFYPILQEYNSQKEAYFLNMFVMKKELFFKYCSFLFGILLNLKDKINCNTYNDYQYRAIGFIGERLTGAYLYSLKKQNKLNIKQLYTTFVENCEDIQVKPIFNKAVAIALISSDYFAPYLATLIQSIKEHASQNDNYDIIVLTRDMSERNKNKIIERYISSHFSIRFRNISFNEQYKISGHVSIETYIRILIPDIFAAYTRVLYLDSDTIVTDNLAKLFNVDIDKYPIGAIKDLTLHAFICDENRFVEGHLTNKQYFNKIGIKDKFSCFNGGVLLLDIRKISPHFCKDISELLDKNNYEYLDQDAFNLYFQGNIFWLDASWNVTPIALDPKIVPTLPKKSKDILLMALKYKKIIHYNSQFKPWFYPDKPYADIWWSYARETPFYEEILARLMDFRMTQRTMDYHAIYILSHPIYFKLKKLRYRLLKHITFGKKRKRYREKYRLLKAQMKKARRLAKQFRRV